MASALQYRPGEGIAIAHGSVAVLLDIAVADPLVARVADLVAAGSEVDDILDVLVTRGIKALPDFGLAEIRGDGARIVVRGGVATRVSGRELVCEKSMWLDSWLAGFDGAQLLLRDAADSLELRFAGGVVLAAAVTIGEPPSSADGAAPSSAPDDVVEDASEAADDAQRRRDADVSPRPEEEGGVDAVESAGDDFAHLFGATMRPPAPAPDAAVIPEVVVPAEDSSVTLATPITMVTEGLGFEEVEVPPVPTLITGMPWEVPGDGGSNDLQPPEVAVPAVGASPYPPPATTAGASARTPLAHEAPFVAPAHDVEPAADRTVNRSALMGLLPEVTVYAARCPDGHFSQAHAGKCRVCRAPIPQQDPMSIARPTLGQLRLSTGGVVPLDRALILGRNPRVPDGYQGEQPNLVRIPDPNKDVSGQHLEVSLDYWNVVVRDLGSTNGTEVILPGEMPTTLRSNEPVIIEPGTRVVLAGVVSFTFEVLP